MLGNDGPEAVVITLEGEYDILRREELAKVLTPAQHASLVIIDMASVSYIDSGCLATLANVKKQMMLEQRAGAIRLVGVQPAIARVLDISGLDVIFEFYGSIPDALAGRNRELGSDSPN